MTRTFTSETLRTLEQQFQSGFVYVMVENMATGEGVYSRVMGTTFSYDDAIAACELLTEQLDPKDRGNSKNSNGAYGTGTSYEVETHIMNQFTGRVD